MWHRHLASQHAETIHFGSVRCFSQTSALKEAKNVPGIYVANVEGRQNSSPILLGLADYFERHLSSVGFFQPVRFYMACHVPSCQCKAQYQALLQMTQRSFAGGWGAISKFNYRTFTTY